MLQNVLCNVRISFRTAENQPVKMRHYLTNLRTLPTSAINLTSVENKDGKMKIGCAINSSSALVTELVAANGYDFLLIDQQHSAIDGEKLRNLIQAAHAGGSKTVPRGALASLGGSVCF